MSQKKDSKLPLLIYQLGTTIFLLELSKNDGFGSSTFIFPTELSCDWERREEFRGVGFHKNSEQPARVEANRERFLPLL